MNRTIQLWAGIVLIGCGIAGTSSNGLNHDGLLLPRFERLPDGASIRLESDSWEGLCAKAAPTLTWNGRDMLWIAGGGQEVRFTLDRAYRRKTADGREEMGDHQLRR